jgi:hypothetical protein
MREAADWVEYCNGTGETALAKLRRKHGFEAPHNVKYWGVGNEVDSPGQIGYKTPEEYARTFTEFSKVMKRVDSGIKLFASAVCSWEDFPLGPEFLYRKTECWNKRETVLISCQFTVMFMRVKTIHSKPTWLLPRILMTGSALMKV